MLSIILFLWIIIQGFSLRGPGFFEQELLVSFFPYMFITDILLVIILGIIWIYHHKRRFIIFIILLSWLGVCSYLKINTIYHSTTPFDQKSTTESLSFFYANIYYQNNQIDSLLNTITQKNPDIIMLVEYSKTHDELLTPILQKDYPYISRYRGSKWYDGDIIFSKIPMKSIDHTIRPWSFSHVTLTIHNHILDIALIHTSAPVSQHYFTMRATQLEELDNLLQSHYTREQLQWRDLIVLGDFNLSPWSSYYTHQLQIPLQQLWLTNITTDLSRTSYISQLPYTWCYKDLPFICSHIDHIWSSNADIKLQQIIVPWSDHTWFYGIFYSN